MNAAQRACASFCISLLLDACGGSGEGLDANGRPLEPGDGGGPLTPDFQSIQSNVLTPICTQCHVGANAPEGLRLDEASSYGALVGVASSQVPGTLRVKPGDPGNSYLVQKLEGRAAVGGRMPLGQPALPDATIAVIRQWIADGAPDAARSIEPVVTVQTVSTSAAEIAVALTSSIDASLVNDTTVSLKPYPGTPTTHALPSRARVSPYNDALILVSPQNALEAGQYRLTLRGTGAAALADLNSVVIDGDGDGTAGGDFEVVLTIGGAP